MARHDVDALSLMAGLAFVGAAVIALLDRGGVPARWAVPVLLIAVGVTGLIATGARYTRRRIAEADQPVPLDDPPAGG